MADQSTSPKRAAAAPSAATEAEAMKLRHIEVFHAVMLTGTVNGAARLLNVTQPAVTKILQRAEDQLGFKLFVRNKGRIVPTAEANVLFAEAAKIFAGLDNMRSIARNLRSSGGLSVRIAAPPALCLGLIPAVVAAFSRDMPEVTIEVHAHHYAEAINAVVRQDVELAIAFNPKDHPALVIDNLATSRFVGCFPASAAAGLPPVVDLATFEQWKFVALSGRDPIGIGVKVAQQLADVTLRASIEVNTNSLALLFVEQEAGAAIIDEYTAASAGGGVAIRHLDPPLTFEVGIITLSNAVTSNAIKRLRQLLYKCHDAHVLPRGEG
jgi:DNA-binding transcriptional LysR family regulator